MVCGLKTSDDDISFVLWFYFKLMMITVKHDGELSYETIMRMFIEEETKGKKNIG